MGFFVDEEGRVFGRVIYCKHQDEGKCCFLKNHQLCTLLNDTTFSDGLCHFRKEKINGPNLYDKFRRDYAGVK